MSKISLLTQGIKGGKEKSIPELSLIKIAVDERENIITIDAFSGFGNTYERREYSVVTFKKGNDIISFESFDAFWNKLKEITIQNY